jgi:hypothetical protein
MSVKVDILPLASKIRISGESPRISPPKSWLFTFDHKVQINRA